MKKTVLFAVMALVTLTGFAQPKFAHVNFTELVQLMPEADAARATMSASSKEAEETYAAMVEEYQTKANQYQQKSASWTAARTDSVPSVSDSFHPMSFRLYQSMLAVRYMWVS